MNDKGILVRANIRLLPIAESGRTAPIRGSYRPNHNFFGPDNRNMTIGFIDLPNGQELHPGESIELPIRFWNWPGLEGQIYPGREWRIQEGVKLVGIGTVLEVLPGH
jgi:translation elongation factor EF-Tu-like GTPase